MSRHAPEEHVQYAVASVLDELGLLWTHVANEALGAGGMLYGSRLVALGVKAGVPDCLIFTAPPCYPEAKGVALELKTKVGRPSQDQKRWLAHLQALGWLTYIEQGTYNALGRLRYFGWDVDAAIQRLAQRGYHLDNERLVYRKGRKAKRERSS